MAGKINDGSPSQLNESHDDEGTISGLIPVSVTVEVPVDASVTGVKLLMGGQSPKFDVMGGKLTVAVPEILDHEIVALDLA